ncbi:thaumatin family protein [Ktedonobacteria bacterium brp13]|nr:thaumatin family protein [Ktedonobacteria bacterium brp13]
MLEKQRYEEDRKRKPFPLLLLVMIAPLLMGALCWGGGSITTIGSSHTTSVSTSSSSPLTNFSQLKMLDAQNGWATTPQAILKTTDGGKTWTDLTPLDWEPKTATAGATTTVQTIVAASFLDAKHAWVVGTTQSTQQYVDAASTVTNSVTTKPDGTVTVDTKSLPTFSTSVYVRSTIDGGQTWVTSNALTAQNLSSVSQPDFINAHEGWLELMKSQTSDSSYVGDVYHSVDGGVTWQQETTTLPAPTGGGTFCQNCFSVNGLAASVASALTQHAQSATGAGSVTGQIASTNQLDGMTIMPACVQGNGSGSSQLPPCDAAVDSSVQGCTVPGITNYVGLATAVAYQSKLWLSQELNANALWETTSFISTPGGVPGQNGNSIVATSPPIAFLDGTGILPVQLQGDPQSITTSNLYLHLYSIKVVDKLSDYQVSDLSPTSTFLAPLVNGQHDLSAPDMQHVFVAGQESASTNTWHLYEFTGGKWVTLTSQTDATMPAASSGNQSTFLNSGLSNLDFISDTEGWATNGPNLYHITIANNVATWSQVFPATNTTNQSSNGGVSRQPGTLAASPTNPPACGNNIVVSNAPPSQPATAQLHTFTFVNSTNQTIWVGANGTTMPNHGSWDGQLAPGSSQSVTVSTPSANLWSGRFWGRTGCTNGKCDTGDCGTVVLCGTGGVPPATLAEFALNGAKGLTYYDVSLVDGYNLPMLITSSDGEPAPDNCGNNPCVDVNKICPSALQEVNASGNVVACKSACEAFGTDQYCCGGRYVPGVCDPNTWPSAVDSAKLFKSAYPHAYSYAYDDATSTYTCTPTCNFTITFGLTPATASAVSTQNSASAFITGNLRQFTRWNSRP